MLVTSSTDANGHSTSYTYDDANRVLTETGPDPDGGGPLAAPVTTYTYDDVGNKRTQTDPRGSTTSFAYDAANRLVSETGPDPDGGGPLAAPVTTHAYDPNGNLASTVEPRGNAAVPSPDDFRTTSTYDAAGEVAGDDRPARRGHDEHVRRGREPRLAPGRERPRDRATPTTGPVASSPSPLPTAE